MYSSREIGLPTAIENDGQLHRQLAGVFDNFFPCPISNFTGGRQKTLIIVPNLCMLIFHFGLVDNVAPWLSNSAIGAMTMTKEL